MIFSLFGGPYDPSLLVRRQHSTFVKSNILNVLAIIMYKYIITKFMFITYQST